MKRNLMFFATALALLVTTAASAQTIKLKATVPFSFIVNRATMPAGEYAVESVDDQGRVLLIGDLNSKAKRLVVSNSCDSVAKATDTKLIFHRYGNRYFLSQVWVRGNSLGHEIPASAREKEVARDFSMQEVVLMAANR